MTGEAFEEVIRGGMNGIAEDRRRRCWESSCVEAKKIFDERCEMSCYCSCEGGTQKTRWLNRGAEKFS